MQYGDSNLITYVEECFTRHPELLKENVIQDISGHKWSVCSLYSNRNDIYPSIKDRLYFEFVRLLCVFRWNDFTFENSKYNKFIQVMRRHDMNRWSNSKSKRNSHVSNSK